MMFVKQTSLPPVLSAGRRAWFRAIHTGDETQTAYEQTVGGTRLIRLKGPSAATGCDIYGKCEWENPGGSIKDRPALWMIKDAEARGELLRGAKGVIVEGTAGNTGIGLALAGKCFGYDVVRKLLIYLQLFAHYHA